MAASIHHKGWLPREGFHADVLGGLAKKTLLHPLLIHPLYLYFALAPRGRQVISQRPRLFKSIRLLAILAALRAINNWLNKRSLNNSATDNYGWDQDKELVIVTGGSDGIGSRIVQGLAERNIRVVVLDVQPLTYDRPKSVSYYACDLNDANAIEDACGQIIQNLGHPTVLINNAGVCTGKHILATTDSDLRLTFGVNALAHYRLARHLLPSMIERDHGMIVTIASSAGWVTAPRMTEYAASKAAAISFHEGLTSELSTFYNAKRVRTVLVCQGYTRTKLFQGFGVSPTSFFGPALHVDTVAEAVVDQVLSGSSGVLVLPGFYKVLTANMRSMPWWFQHNIRKKLVSVMRNWNGRQVVQEGIGERASGT